MREKAGIGSLSDRSVIICRHQTQGKGQGMNTWYDAPNESLLASVFALHLPFSPDEIFFLNMAVSLALQQTLKAISACEIRIKWPNDLLIHEKKVAGILIENQWRGEHLLYSILGMGVNLLEKNFPPELPGATSLRMESGQSADATLVLLDFCHRFERISSVLGSHSGRAWLIETYHKELWRLNEEVSFRSGEQRYRGLLQEVKTDGGIVLVTKGRAQTFYHGEIKLIRH